MWSKKYKNVFFFALLFEKPETTKTTINRGMSFKKRKEAWYIHSVENSAEVSSNRADLQVEHGKSCKHSKQGKKAICRSGNSVYFTYLKKGRNERRQTKLSIYKFSHFDINEYIFMFMYSVLLI